MLVDERTDSKLGRSEARPVSEALPEVIVDPETQAQCETMLREALIRRSYPSVDINVVNLMATDLVFADRFNYFTSRIPESAFRCLLISGCLAGSEMICARKVGFQRIHSTEIEQDYIDICKVRLAEAEGIESVLYDGQQLPYPDEYFSAIVSGHVIEHTRSPYVYLREHMRVLKPGGAFYMEFPHRYHRTELHLNLPSAEFLPRPLRWITYRYLTSPLSHLCAETKQNYATSDVEPGQCLANQGIPADDISESSGCPSRKSPSRHYTHGDHQIAH